MEVVREMSWPVLQRQPHHRVGGGDLPDRGESCSRGKYANYLLTVNSNVAGQKGWRRCGKCQGLFFGGNAGSHCPAGGAHSKTGSGDYVVVHNTPTAPGQADWRWCSKCRRLFFAGNPGSTVPRRPGSTDTTGSGNYTLAMMGPGEPQQDWHRCKRMGLFIDANPGSKYRWTRDRTARPPAGNYVLMVDYAPGTAPGQPNWRWWQQDPQGLFFAGNPTSHCPATKI